MTEEAACDIPFEDLPTEVLINIMSQRSLKFTDVARLARTCTKLNSRIAGDLNDVWRVKHSQRWPGAYKACRNLNQKIDWRSECEYGVQMGVATTDLLKNLWPTAYSNSNVCHSTFVPFADLIGATELVYQYVKEELLNLINDERPADLTMKYHACHAVRFVRQEYLKAKWQNFCALPVEEQLLETGAVLVAQWCQPFIEVTDDLVGARLDAIAEKVLDFMRKTYPAHPIHSIPHQVRQTWRYKSLGNNLWNGTQSRQVIEALELVLCKCLRFRGSRERYHDTDNCFINKVLEGRQGIPITMNIVIESVARRLGIHTEPRIQRHLVLLWKENFLNNVDPATSGEYFIDIFNEQGFLQRGIHLADDGRNQCPFRGHVTAVGRTTPIRVIERLAAGVELARRLHMPYEGNFEGIRSALELLCVIEPTNLIYILHLGRMYMLNNISTKGLCIQVHKLVADGLPADARAFADHILQSISFEPVVLPLQVRTAEHRKGVSFAVGMVMRHRLYNYKCVITGWDPACAASSEWKQEMNVHHLQFKDNQPFYNVLVQDSSYRYAAQENLEPIIGDSEIIHTHDIGRFFAGFRNGCYVPNHMKEMEYPDDGEVRRQFYGMAVGESCTT